MDRFLDLERRTGVSDDDIQGFLSKVDDVKSTIDAMMKGEIRPEDVRIPGEKTEEEKREEEEARQRRAAERIRLRAKEKAEEKDLKKTTTKKTATKKKTAKKKAAAKKKSTKASKSGRMKMVWRVLDPKSKVVATFAYPKQDDAKAKAAKLSERSGEEYRVQGAKVPMED